MQLKKCTQSIITTLLRRRASCHCNYRADNSQIELSVITHFQNNNSWARYLFNRKIKIYFLEMWSRNFSNRKDRFQFMWGNWFTVLAIMPQQNALQQNFDLILSCTKQYRMYLWNTGCFDCNGRCNYGSYIIYLAHFVYGLYDILFVFSWPSILIEK